MTSSQSRPALRGDALRDHIVQSAKDVFLEVGYDRASMDVVAARAATSKRTLYSHWGSKESLFLAVADYARVQYLERLASPDAFSDDPVEAVVLFCGAFLEVLTWDRVVRTCRLFIAESEHQPQAAARAFAAIFTTTEQRLSEHLVSACGQDETAAEANATQLLSQAVYPHAMRVLFGTDAPRRTLPARAVVSDDLDLAPIRAEVGRLLPR